MIVERLFVYPVKSLAGIALQEARLGNLGIYPDRLFMLRDGSGRFVSQREEARLALFDTRLEGSELIITYRPDNSSLRIPLKPVGSDLSPSEVWNDRCLSLRLGEEADLFFSRILSRRLEMVFLPEESERPVDKKYAEALTSFTDGFPILMIGSASLDQVNEKLSEKGEGPVGWDRFRPGIVVKTQLPFEEDKWRDFSIGEARFRAVKPCARCIMTCIDQQTAIQGKEPLRTLSEFRRQDGKVLFGVNVIPLTNTGTLKCGDAVSVESYI